MALAVGHMADLIRTYCGSGARYGLKLRYMREQEPLGTVGPLAGLPSSLRDRSMLVMNGDLLTTLRFDDLIRAHAESGAIATLAVRRRRIEIEFGVVELNDMLDGPRRVVGYREKPDLEAVVSMGVYVLQAEVLDYIEPGERLDFFRSSSTGSWPTGTTWRLISSTATGWTSAATRTTRRRSTTTRA